MLSSDRYIPYYSHDNPIGALVAYRNLSACLSEYMETTRKSVQNTEKVREFDIKETILQILLSMMEKAESDGMSKCDKIWKYDRSVETKL